MNRTGLRDSDIVAIRRTPDPESGQVVVARFGDEVTLKRFVRIDARHVELRPESTNRAHKVMKLDWRSTSSTLTASPSAPSSVSCGT